MHRYSQFISRRIQKARDLSSDLPIAEIGEYRLNGVAVGKHALAGTVRFYVRGSLDGEAHAEALLRRYFNASLLQRLQLTV
jgi:hypothetical protein